MAHKTLIGGTEYEIEGGRTLVNGTGYDIELGKTLIGGTEYEIGFAVPDLVLFDGSSLNGGNYTNFYLTNTNTAAEPVSITGGNIRLSYSRAAITIPNVGTNYLWLATGFSLDAIDLTPYKTLSVTAKRSAAYGAELYIGLGTSATSEGAIFQNPSAAGMGGYSTFRPTTSAQTFEFDVSSKTGSRYIKIATTGTTQTNGTCYMLISSIVLKA